MSCLNNLQDEIPHGINVEIEKMKKRANRDIYDIEALIVVERENHKGMVIGKGGNKLKKINTFARKNIEVFLNARVNLKVLVKVDKDWREKQFKVREFGYR